MKKILIFVILLALLMPVNVFAATDVANFTVIGATTATPAGITYSMATKMAIANSADLKKAQVSLLRAEESNSNVYVPMGFYSPSMLQLKKQYTVAEKSAEIQLSVAKEQVANGAVNSIDSLYMLECEKAVALKKVEFQNLTFLQAKVKKENGLLSEIELALAKQKYEAEVQALKTLESKIQIARIDINSILGLASTTVPAFVIEVTYSAIGDFNVDRHIRSSVAYDPFLYLAGQNVEVADLKLITYEHNDSSYYVGQTSYKLSELNVRSAKINKSDTEKKLKDQINEHYNTLLQLESSINGLEINLAQAQLGYKALEIQKKYGLTTNLVLLESKQGVDQLVHQIETLKLQHEQLKKIFLKPYLAAAYVSM